ncbi:hypothetical protein LCGC14_1872320, partial [marine sediment metagenome]
TADVTIGFDGTELTDSIGIGVAIKEAAAGAAEETATYNSDSHIWDTETATFNSDSNVYDTDTSTFNSNSQLYAEETETFTSDSNVYDTKTATFSSDSNVYAEETGTFNSTSHIWDTETATFTSDSRIYAKETFTSNSHIWDTVTATFTSNSFVGEPAAADAPKRHRVSPRVLSRRISPKPLTRISPVLEPPSMVRTSPGSPEGVISPVVFNKVSRSMASTTDQKTPPGEQISWWKRWYRAIKSKVINVWNTLTGKN